MLDVLSNTYKIATRVEAFETPGINAPARNLPRIAPLMAPAPKRIAQPHKPRRAPWLIRAARWAAHRFEIWQERRQAREYALRMSEHQLRDIGLRREELLRGINNSR